MSRDAPNLAVLIDSDNAQAAVISELLAEVSRRFRGLLTLSLQ